MRRSRASPSLERILSTIRISRRGQGGRRRRSPALRLTGLAGLLALAAALVVSKTGLLRGPELSRADRTIPASRPPGIEQQQSAVVKQVIDGDTVKLADGRTVRYIGIDTPEMRRRDGNRWVKNPEPYAIEATDANRMLVEGRTVRLEFDVQLYDRYHRLLAYVHVGDDMVNAKLLEDGYAQQMTVPPNVKYAERFRLLVKEARRMRRGLWALPNAGSTDRRP